MIQDLTNLTDDFLSSRTDQETSLILLPVVAKPTGTSSLHHISLIRVCNEQFEIKMIDTSLETMDARERHRLISISRRVAALVESDAPMNDYENWDISFEKNFPSSSEFCAPLVLEFCRQELSEHPTPVSKNSIRTIMTEQLKLIDHPVLKVTSSDGIDNTPSRPRIEKTKKRKRKLEFAIPFASVENQPTKRRSQSKQKNRLNKTSN